MLNIWRHEALFGIHRHHRLWTLSENSLRLECMHVRLREEKDFIYVYLTAFYLGVLPGALPVPQYSFPTMVGPISIHCSFLLGAMFPVLVAKAIPVQRQKVEGSSTPKDSLPVSAGTSGLESNTTWFPWSLTQRASLRSMPPSPRWGRRLAGWKELMGTLAWAHVQFDYLPTPRDVPKAHSRFRGFPLYMLISNSVDPGSLASGTDMGK